MAELKMDEVLNHYWYLEKKIHDYFGYEESWRVIPMNDRRDVFWCLDGEGPGRIGFADTEEELRSTIEKTGIAYFQDDIYTQRFLSKWVFRGADYTMIACNPGSDGNKLLRVFDNAKEIKGYKLRAV